MPRAATPEEQRRAVELAYRDGGLDLEGLWLSYFTLGGNAGMVELEACLLGLMPLPAGQSDILAHAVNERLDDLLTRRRVPYNRVVRSPPAPTGLLAGLVRLLDGMEKGPPERIVPELDAAAAALDLQVTMSLVDYGQSVLIPLHADPAHPRSFRSGVPVPIESTLAGQAYQRVQTMVSETGGRPRLWVPLVDGSERLGVLEIRLPEAEDVDDPVLQGDCRLLSRLLGHLVTASTSSGDALDTVRRLRPRTTSAELVWNLLPPLTAGSDRFIIAGQFEPSSSVGGDAFDYALSDDHAQFAIFDSTGHSMKSGLVTTTALAAYRSVRRNGLGLMEQSAEIDDAVTTQFLDQGLYVTSVLADLDLGTGRLTYINAGHPAPVLIRDGRIVKTLRGGSRPLFGVGDDAAVVGTEMLEVGDTLMLYTDGITEARDEHGEFFGMHRLADHLRRATAAQYPAPETVRRLVGGVMAHQHGRLQDDATVLLATWLSAQPTSPGSREEMRSWY